MISPVAVPETISEEKLLLSEFKVIKPLLVKSPERVREAPLSMVKAAEVFKVISLRLIFPFNPSSSFITG